MIVINDVRHDDDVSILINDATDVENVRLLNLFKRMKTRLKT